MEITIKAEAKEIAALVVAIQERQIELMAAQTPGSSEIRLERATSFQAKDGTRIEAPRISLP